MASWKKLQSQRFTTAGAITFNVPAGVSKVMVTMVAGGCSGAGNGSSQNAVGCGGGGAGEYCIRVPYAVTPGGTVSGTVGAKGVGVNGAGSNFGFNAGTDSVFGSLTVRTGTIMPSGNNTSKGGGNTGGNSAVGIAEGTGFFSGGNSGPASTNGAGSQGVDGGVGGSLGSGTGGGGGASSPWGQGGTGANTSAGDGGSAASTAWGAGGGGSSNANGANRKGGDGADGMILVEWEAP